MSKQIQVTTGIKYSEPDQDSYAGVILSWKKAGGKESGRKKKIFNTGFPPLDLISAHNYMVKELGAENIFTACWSSSVDHFVMDGDKYEWYTDEEDGGEWLRASAKFKKTAKFKKLKAKFMEERVDLKA